MFGYDPRTMSAPRPSPRRIRIGYSLGSLASGPFSTVPGLLLLPFLTDKLAVPAVFAGLLVLLPKAWDVAFNPVVGRLSDRGGHQLRPILLRGGLVLAVLFAAMFLPPLFGSSLANGAYVGVLFLACATAFAFFQVPYVAMSAVLTDDYDERTRLISWRIAVLAVAILVSGAGAPAIRDAVGEDNGYRVMGVFIAVLIVVGTLGVHLGTAGVPDRVRAATGTALRDLVDAVRGSRRFRLLLIAFVVQSVGVGTLLAGVDYFARIVLRDEGAQTILFAGYIAPALLVMPLWQRVGLRWGKRVGFVAATVLFGVSIASLCLVEVLPRPAVYGFVALAGAAYAGLQVFPQAMLPDVISAEQERTGAGRAGLLAGMWTAGETLGLALGPGIFGLILAAGGYVASTDATAAQPGTASTAIILGFSVVPGLLVLAALPALRRSTVEQAAA